MSNEIQEGEPVLTRRMFLKQKAIQGAEVVASSTLLALAAGCTRSPEAGSAAPPRFALPAGLISDKKLAQDHITVHNTPTVKLHFKRSAYDQFPVFSDAQYRTIQGLTITLVDNPFISWNAIARLPEGPRTVHQAFSAAPDEFPDSYWERVINYWVGMKKESQDFLDLMASNPTDAELAAQDIRLFVSRDEVIAVSQKSIQGADRQIEFLSDRQRAVESLAEKGVPPIGGLHAPIGEGGMMKRSLFESMLATPDKYTPTQLQRIADLLNHSEYLDQYYVFMSVGGSRIPNPKYSYPKPENFNTRESRDPNSRFVTQKPDTPNGGEPEGAAGFSLRHEIFHYDPNMPIASTEHNADQRALDSITLAAIQRQKTRSAAGYGLVLESPLGVTET